MVRAAGLGAIAAMLQGIVGGLWAAAVGAPPEAAGGVASGLGGAMGLGAFGFFSALKAFRRRGWFLLQARA